MSLSPKKLTTLFPLRTVSGIIGLCLLAAHAHSSDSPSSTDTSQVTEQTSNGLDDSRTETAQGFVRINSTVQTFNAAQPWQKNNPSSHRGLGTLLESGRVITTADLVADHTYLEFESADETQTIPAKVITVDYAANLALLEPAQQDITGTFFAKLKPLALAKPVALGETVTLWQIKENGMPLQSSGVLQSADVTSTLVRNNYNLTYSIKTSLQSASSSYTLPATHQGKLLGILHTYDSDDQICETLSIETIQHFLDDFADGDYQGFPSLGVGITSTDDPQFKAWLKIPNHITGLYVTRVNPNSTAEAAGLKKGDVITQARGQNIDQQGYFNSPKYGKTYWSHLITTAKIGEKIKLHILRDGKELTLTAPLQKKPSKLIPAYIFDNPPTYLMKGGLVFQELSSAYLEAFGDKWRQKVPINLLDVYDNPNDYEKGRKRLVFLSRVIPTPATIGYDNLSHLIVTKVNGQDIASLNDIDSALKTPLDGLHKIEFTDQPYTIYLDPASCDTIDQQLLQRGLTSLSRLTPEEDQKEKEAPTEKTPDTTPETTSP